MRLREIEGVKDQGSVDALRADWHVIQPDPDNDLRDLTTPENRAHIERLKDSIEKVGVKFPLEVRYDENRNVFAIDGRCRLVALAELEAEGRPFPAKVTVLQELRNTERKKRMLNMLSAGTDRKNLSDREFARGLYRAMEFGYTEKEVCAEMGWKSVATLHNHTAVLTLTPALSDMVDQGQISRTEAVKVQRKIPDVDLDQIKKDAEDEHKRLNKKGTPKIRPRHVANATGKPDKVQVPQQRMNRGASETAGSETEEREPASSVALEPAVPQAPASTSPSALTQEARETFKQAFDDPNTERVRILSEGITFEAKAVQYLIEAAAPFAAIANDIDLNARDDDELELIEVRIRDLKRVALMYARATGGEG